MRFGTVRRPAKLLLALMGAAACQGSVRPETPAPMPLAPDGGGGMTPRPGPPVAPGSSDAAGPVDAAAPVDRPANERPAAGDVGGAQPDAGSPAPVEAGTPGAGAARVFDPTVLHRIDIQVESQYLAQLDTDLENRVPCTITFDGVTLPQSGIRKKGGNGSQRPLTGKPAFSIKFNQFVKGQKLYGLSKLLLNNAVQDPSFLSEHMAYEIVRRSGGAAPLTAHGIGTFNGRPMGLYVVREAFNDDFVERSFGKANTGGNFYEGGEFVRSPDSPELKDEREEMRSRADIREASRIINTTPDAQWVAAVGAKLDFSSFMIGWAVEALVDHWDGYFFGPHNYYLYHHPGSDRFVFLVAGMDSIFGRIRDPRDSLKVLLPQKFLALPETKVQFQTLLAQIISGLDAAALQARIDQAARTIHSASPADAATMADYANFDRAVNGAKADMMAIKRWPVPVL